MGIPISQIVGEQLVERLITADRDGATAEAGEHTTAGEGRPAPLATRSAQESFRFELGNGRRPVDLLDRRTVEQ